MDELQHLVRTFVAHYGLLALFVLLTIEEAGVWLPLPGDLLIMYFGYQAVHSSNPALGTLGAVLTITAAVVCGSTLLYVLSRRYRLALRRFGRIMRLNERHLLWMEHQVHEHGTLVIIPGRLIPGLRIPTTAVCGALRLPLGIFLPSITVAALIWGALYFALGAAGPDVISVAWHFVGPEIEEWFLPGVAIGLLAGLALFLGWRWGWRPPTASR